MKQPDVRPTASEPLPIQPAAKRTTIRPDTTVVKGWECFHVVTDGMEHVLTNPGSARKACETAGLGRVAVIEQDRAKWDCSDCEGQRTLDLRKRRPDGNLFLDGCPDDESSAQVSNLADRLIAQLRVLNRTIATFSHPHLERVPAVRWAGLTLREAQHFLLDTASVSALGDGHNHQTEPGIALWNSPCSLRMENFSNLEERLPARKRTPRQHSICSFP